MKQQLQQKVEVFQKVRKDNDDLKRNMQKLVLEKNELEQQLQQSIDHERRENNGLLVTQIDDLKRQLRQKAMRVKELEDELEELKEDIKIADDEIYGMTPTELRKYARNAIYDRNLNEDLLRKREQQLADWNTLSHRKKTRRTVRT